MSIVQELIALRDARIRVERSILRKDEARISSRELDRLARIHGETEDLQAMILQHLYQKKIAI